MSMRIGIDPGHGGRDPGAVGQTGLREKDVTLAISLEIERLLKQAGLEVIMTRRNDITVDLDTRTTLLNNAKCDYVVSVHCNSVADPTPNYFAAFVIKLGGKAEELAHRIIKHVTNFTGWNWGADDDGLREKNLHIIRETNMPATLLECGFISNLKQEAQLRDPFFQKSLARSIANGILDYLGRESVIMPDWKYKLMEDAANAGLIDGAHGHLPDEPASKWFVLAVCLNLLKVLKGGK